MSTLKVDTYLTRGGASEIAIDKLKGVTAAGSMLVVAEGGTVTTNLQQGLTKHLCHWDGSGTPAVDDSFNNGSLTDNGTGDFTQNFTNNMANKFYISNGHGYFDDGADTAAAQWTLKDNGGIANYKLTSSMRGEIVFQNTGANRSNYDYPANWSSLDGDLA